MKTTVRMALMSGILFASCTDTRDTVNILQTGEASWYGPGLHGKRTSSGEIYDENKMTAAHRTLPFDTVVRVVNKANNKSVEVRINDRGPYVGNRIIDLSRAAAQELDMLDHGKIPVRLKLVEAGGPIPDDLEQEVFTIQIGEYNDSHYADIFIDQLEVEARIEREVRSDRPRYMIYYGHYTSIEDARDDLESLKQKEINGFIKQIN